MFSRRPALGILLINPQFEAVVEGHGKARKALYSQLITQDKVDILAADYGAPLRV
jgi:hypothetical protein